MRRLIAPFALGFALFYLILRPVARWLLFSAHASDSVYLLAVSSLMFLASFSVSLFVARGSQLGWGRAVVAALASTAMLAALVAAAVVAMSWIAENAQAFWLYADPAGLVMMLALSAALVAVTLGVIRVGRPRRAPTP